MKIKSAKSFRNWYKTQIKEIENDNPTHNENFIGTYHKEDGKKTIKGFFEMYHGDKPDIASYLPSILKIAEDGQAIYEFLQNAADSGSTHFYIFYNEKYFLAINNGSPFTIDGLKSILNIAQTTKKDPDKIGRFGIGFKLAHRLVGKNEGTHELVNQNKGPILFSWSKLNDLESLLNKEQIEPICSNEESNQEYNEAPYLLKLLLTNFPSDPGETVKDIKYQDKILFPHEELDELRNFLKENFEQHQENLNLDDLNQGSIFFIKLGEDKKELLDKDYEDLVNGIQYSMNTLKRLQKVYINNHNINKIPLHLEEGIIKKGSEEFNYISPEYKDFDIKFAIGFNTIQFGNDKSYEQINLLKEKPNFYKYFPLGDEINGLGFIIHCDSFSNEANRRKLHEDDVNKNLFPELAQFIVQRLEAYKIKDRKTFLNHYASILLSDAPERQNNKWLKPAFYDILLEYIVKNIPTKNGFLNNPQNVKINNLKQNLNLSDFGINDIEWFEWNNKSDNLLIDEAENKLKIQSWDIRDIIENANLEDINQWIENCDDETYLNFLTEIKDSQIRISTRIKLCHIKLFKFSDKKYYSFYDITGYDIGRFDGDRGNYLFTSKNKPMENYIFHSLKTQNIDIELRKLDFITCTNEISQYVKFFFKDNWNVYYYERTQNEKLIFDRIAEKCKTNTLLANEKKKLFLNFINDNTKFDNVAEGILKNLYLFCDSNSEIKPLKELIGKIKTPNWLNTYKISRSEYFSELNPFLITESEDIFNEVFEKNQDEILPELTTTEEIKSLIQLYQENQKSFFKDFIIRKDNNDFVIDIKTDETYQVQSADKDARKFLDENCAENLFVLPYEFVEDYKDEEGIIKADDLHSLILEFVDVDEHKDILVDIVKYKAKYKFLQELSELRFNSEKQYSKDNYEYKILNLACNELKENDFQEFKNKIIIETEEQELSLAEIPPFIDSIKIDKYEISLAKILPDNYKNSDQLSSIINRFITLGINKDRIGNLFGINEEPEPSDIFQIFYEQVEVLENAEQLAFLFLYGLYIEEIDFNHFKALNVNEEEIDLGYDKYLTDFDFVQQSEILHQKYRNITKIFKDFPIVVEDNDNLLLIKEPYFEEDKFICPYIKEDLSDEEKISLISFLYDQWNKKNLKNIIKNINWNTIDDIDTLAILDFNPNHSVFPNQYACESEKLPEYLIEWINDDENKVDFISDLGIWTEKSIVVELRKFLGGDLNDFQNNKLAQEKYFNDDETILFNTFEWLKENDLTLKTTEQYETFKKIVEVINDNRENNDLIIQEWYDTDYLEEKSTEWKKIKNYTICLYDGEMPVCVGLDKIDDYIFYQFDEDNYAINENVIYLNNKEDKKKTLQKIASDDENDFTFEYLWDLFGENSKREQELEREIARLQQQVAKTSNATLGSGLSTDLSKNDQKEANREAKEQVKQRLENEGFEFTKGIDNYSTIDGVMKDGIEYPLVVKSYKSQEEPLKIGANEWIQLIKPNSMFWVNFGNGTLGCLKLHELLRNQDKLTISFSTENLDKEDRLDKFAELLHYFGNVHFDFNSVMPSNIASNLEDYRFDERKIEEDLSDDDSNLL